MVNARRRTNQTSYTMREVSSDDSVMARYTGLDFELPVAMGVYCGYIAMQKSSQRMLGSSCCTAQRLSSLSGMVVVSCESCSLWSLNSPESCSVQDTFCHAARVEVLSLFCLLDFELEEGEVVLLPLEPSDLC